MLKDPSGPFRDCVSRIDPSAFFQNCLYDVCLYQGKGSMQCKSLTAYTTACQAKGITVYPWRTSSFCIQCPANSHYDICVSGCPTNCQNLTIYESCNAPCQEGCTCDSGYVVSGVQCVPLSQCGCQYKDRYYKIGQVFYPDGLCAEECVCNGKDGVSCKQFTCGPQEKCEVKNGVRSCQPTAKGVCSISGDPHYNTFDNDTFTFQGTCTYIAAEGCHLEGTHLSPFSVVVENEKWYAMSDDPNVSVAKLVAVEVYGMIIILRRNQIGLVMVNGAMTNLPLNLNNGQIKVFQDGTNDVILTDFGLKVTYDLVYHVTITVPSNYYGKTCGLCGNFNGKKGDEFQLPDGKTTKDLNAFGAAWKVSVPGVVCDNGCSGDVCPKCDPSKQPTIESDCSIITNPNGPFAACQSIIDPAPYFRDCVYDVCIVGSTGNTKMLCHSIAAYMIDCQNVGVQVQNWRSANFCRKYSKAQKVRQTNYSFNKVRKQITG
uniref:VWFD domain-containing protein n=1 Tax=Denticeps clupeoides TaxID=299321 RepID=A0AAY4C1A6_9TELE